MADKRRDGDPDEMVLADEDRLPWLEAVEEDGDGEGPSIVKLVAAILIGLVAIGVIVGGLYWLGNRGPAGAGNDVIAAEQGDYKQRPENPGGMNLSGEGNTSYAASEGAQPKGSLNLNGATAAPAPPRPQPAAPQPQPAQSQPARATPPPAPAGPSIQLGAFGSQAGANAAWTELARRFRYLAPLAHRVEPVPGRNLFRLRASGADAASVCRRLQVAGEACTPVN